MRRLWQLLWAPLLLAGCAEGTAPPLFGAAGRGAPQAMTVAGGTVTIAGPKGYCVDRRGSRNSGDAAFVLLARCDALGRRSNAAQSPAGGLLTASVDDVAGDVPRAEALARLVRTPEGRAALARDGDAGSVEVLSTRREGSAVLLRIRDIGPDPVPGLDRSYWRALFALNGRLVTLSVNSFQTRPISVDEGLRLLRDFLRRTQRETAARGAPLEAQ